MRTRVVLWAFVAVGALVSWPGRVAVGQEVALAARSPRFLYAPSVNAKPVVIDVSRTAVLRHVVSLQVEQPTVGTLLASIERQTGLRFAYGKEFRTDRPLTLRADSITVASALAAILYDAGVDVLLSPGGHMVLVKRTESLPPPGSVVGRVTDAKTQAAIGGATVVVQGTSHSATTGSDGRYRIAGVAPGTYTVRARYIGYTPGTASVTVSADQEATADFTLEKSAQRLDEVVTTGTLVPTEVKALPTPISIVTSEDFERQNLQRVDQLFRGTVPGTVAWDQGRDVLSIIMVRGTSTLSNVPTIKTFIDGVEVANPEYIATIDPNSIDRVEITRGPQASTLYGAGALDGVMQIFTKKGQLGLARPQITAKASAGGVSGLDGQGTTFKTDNTVSVLGGDEKTSYQLGGMYRHTGEFTPSYLTNDWGVSAGGQTTQGPVTLSGSARYTDKSYTTPWKTQFRSYLDFSQPPDEADRLRQQTYGLSATLRATRNWQHTLTLGYDQYYVAGENTQPRFTTPADSFVAFFTIHEAKTSILYHTDVKFRLSPGVGVTLSAGANHEADDYLNSFTFGATRTTGSLDGSTFVSRRPSTNTGYFGQMQLSFAERLFVTGGLRAERNANFGTDFGTAWSPRVGAAYVVPLAGATLKLRASYGESIRAPTSGERDRQVSPYIIQLANPNLAPERQRGEDAGVDLYVGRASLGVTYYNQRAVDLIQTITLGLPGVAPTVQSQNISRVKNDGWEFELYVPAGKLAVSGTYSIMNSTVQELFPNYPPGGYQVGDPVLGVPHRSAGATLTYSPLPGTTLTAGVTHIGHWIQTDWISEFGFFFGGQPYRGTERAYWIQYPTVTKLAVGVSQTLRRGVSGFVQVDNLGNNLRYEQDNQTFRTPRTIMVGANLRY